MRILHADEFEKLFPVRPLFVQRDAAETDFHPLHRIVIDNAGILHVAKVFPTGDGAGTERSILDRAEQVRFATGFDSGCDNVSHD